MHPSNNKKRLPIDKLRSTDEIIVNNGMHPPPSEQPFRASSDRPAVVRLNTRHAIPPPINSHPGPPAVRQKRRTAGSSGTGLDLEVQEGAGVAKAGASRERATAAAAAAAGAGRRPWKRAQATRKHKMQTTSVRAK